MAKLTTENLIKVLDACVVTPHWRKAMATIRASEALAFSWRAKSIKALKDSDTSSEFFIEWRGVWDFWHCHAGRARTENVQIIESAIRDRVLNGETQKIYGPDQRPIYLDDPRFVCRTDDYVREVLDMADFEDVTPWHRLLHDENGNAIQATKQVLPPAPVQLRVLEQDRRYVERKEVDAHVTGEITVAKPLQRLLSEPRPDVAKLRALAALPADKRREQIGASKVPLDAHGNRTIPRVLPPGHRDDDLPKIEPLPLQPTRPSYARPPQSLDNAGTGRGEVPSGGFRVR